MLMENPGLTISPCEVPNPATLLPTPEGSLPFHSCLESLDHWTKPQEGLSEDPLTNLEEIWYTDGSSFVLDGKRRVGYVIISSSCTEVAWRNQAANQAAKRAALQNNDLIGVATLVHRLICQKLLHILKVRLLKPRVRAFKKIIWGGSKRRGSFFSLGTSNESWLTFYIPPLI